LFQNYIGGLSDAGWQGSISKPRYGFCVSVAARSAWELPRLLKILGESDTGDMKDKVFELIRVNEIHMACAEEADQLLSLIGKE
jgi:hypothetical protein